MPSNGIFARVLQEGEISVRDTIQVLPETGKEPFRAAVITLSDKGAAGEREDKSDPHLLESEDLFGQWWSASNDQEEKIL